jgi:hypothetical protein
LYGHSLKLGTKTPFGGSCPELQSFFLKRTVRLEKNIHSYCIGRYFHCQGLHPFTFFTYKRLTRSPDEKPTMNHTEANKKRHIAVPFYPLVL